MKYIKALFLMMATLTLANCASGSKQVEGKKLAGAERFAEKINQRR